MPTTDRIGALRVAIFTNDHRPAHVHVIGNVCEAVFRLDCPTGPPELRENDGFTQSEIGKIRAGIASKLAHHCAEWRTIHGEP